MNKITFNRSLLEFNRRVLYSGNISQWEKYTFEDINKKLFFNKVFLSNMKEMFEKYNMEELIEDYKELLDTYTSNVSMIKRIICNMNSHIKFTNDNSFEQRLIVKSNLDGQVISKRFDSMNSLKEKMHSILEEYGMNQIYYITLEPDGAVNLSYINSKSSVYQNVMKCDFNDYTLYLDTIDSIILYLNARLDGITFAISFTNVDNNILKIEYTTDSVYKENGWAYRALKVLFPNTFIFQNKYLYIDDLEYIIKSNINEKKNVSQKYKEIEFSTFFKKDYLIEYPKDSFDQYLQLLNMAAHNNSVSEIYMTLYRIGNDPAIYYILRDAVLNGIKVFVNIELCASGEYDINSMWMKEMMNVGIHVSTYMRGQLKVHSKLTLIRFNNKRSIAQIGTGNYHTKTTSQYTDLSLITSNNDICDQVKCVFDILTGKRNQYDFNNNVLVTKYNCRETLIDLIKKESSKGKKGYIVMKCNSLDDPAIIKELDKASQNGCKIVGIIRGVCTWIPDTLGENVKIKSIVWDKLEHSRIYCFGRLNPTIYIGSLDPIKNKIDKRIETLVKIKDPDITMRLCKYLNKYIVNTRDSWLLTDCGMYIKE